MAAFSRGLRLRPSLLATTCRQPLPLRLSPRLLFSSLRDAKSPAKTQTKTQAKTPTKLPSSTAPKPVTSQPPRPSRVAAAAAPVLPPNASSYALIHQLSQRGAPTLLYEAGSHFWMKLSSWSAAAMFYGYAAINWYTMVLHAPADIGAWVPYAFTAICAATAGFGSYFFLASANIVRTIRAVPTASMAKIPVGVNPKTTPIHLEVTVKRLLPVKSKIIIVPPHEVALAHRASVLATTTRPKATTAAQERALSRKEAAEAKKQWEYDREHLMTVPFRHAGKGMRAAWHGVTRALTKSGFTPMKADGQKLKLDIESGWALENGRVLERLVKIGI